MIEREEIKNNLITVRKKAPVVLNVTNFLVMNNTARALLALGASPIMAHAVEEVKDMVDIASALVINMGTPSAKWVEAMLIAGKAARAKGIPVVFDPAGVGTTPYRNQVAETIIKECKPDIIRANAAEIMVLAKKSIKNLGGESVVSSKMALETAKQLAHDLGCVVVISGEHDLITDGQRGYKVKNGHQMMPLVVGMGCMATAEIAAYAAIDRDYIKACVTAMATMGIAGKIAAEKSNGPASMLMNFIDGLFNLDGYTLKENVAYEEIE